MNIQTSNASHVKTHFLCAENSREIIYYNFRLWLDLTQKVSTAPYQALSSVAHLKIFRCAVGVHFVMLSDLGVLKSPSSRPFFFVFHRAQTKHELCLLLYHHILHK